MRKGERCSIFRCSAALEGELARANLPGDCALSAGAGLFLRAGLLVRGGYIAPPWIDPGEGLTIDEDAKGLLKVLRGGVAEALLRGGVAEALLVADLRRGNTDAADG